MAPESLNTFRSLVLANAGVVVSAVPQKLVGWSITNINAAIQFVKLYDKATAASAADTPLITIGIPPGATVHAGFTGGIKFVNGISARSVTTQPDAGATGSTAGDVACHLFY